MVVVGHSPVGEPERGDDLLPAAAPVAGLLHRLGLQLVDALTGLVVKHRQGDQDVLRLGDGRRVAVRMLGGPVSSARDPDCGAQEGAEVLAAPRSRWPPPVCQVLLRLAHHGVVPVISGVTHGPPANSVAGPTTESLSSRQRMRARRVPGKRRTPRRGLQSELVGRSSGAGAELPGSVIGS